MCTYSMVSDHFMKQYPSYQAPVYNWPVPYNGPTKEQFQELIDLLKAAKRIDIATGQPDCELESKKQTLRDMAKQLGIQVEIP